jgi:hypothetical protein
MWIAIMVHQIQLHFNPTMLVILLLTLPPLQARAQEKKETSIVFARDIAPILVANCLECHNDQQSRGSFSMATPAKLMTGGESGVVIEPGQADKSLLVRHIRGDEQPLMPNNRRALALETIDTIARWVAAGAKLDEGQADSANLRELAWSPERIARDRVERMTPDDRQKSEKTALAAIMAKVRPNSAETDAKTVQTSDHFGAIGVAEKTVAIGMLDALEKSRSDLLKLLGSANNPLARDYGRQLVFVFDRPAEYVEFQRQNGIEAVESTAKTVGRLGGEWPITAILVDKAALDASQLPSPGKNSSKGKSKSKSSKNSFVEPGFRSINAIAVEAFSRAVLESYAAAPAWLKNGMAVQMAAEYDTDKTYYQTMLTDARTLGPGRLTGGWEQRAESFLKDQLPPQISGPLAFSLMQWLNTTHGSKTASFVQAATRGEAKLNETIQSLWGVDRKTFIANWSNWLIRAGAAGSRKGRQSK